jgi:hypothetical protein
MKCGPKKKHVQGTKSMPKKSVILSIDIEADGPAPTVSSCLMLGFAIADYHAMPEAGDASTDWLLEKKAWCLKPQPGKQPEERCMREFWSKNEDVLAHIRRNEQDVREVLVEFIAWYRGITEQYDVVSWVARPASYDYMWFAGIYHEFGPEAKPAIPFSIRDISTLFWEHDKVFKQAWSADFYRHPSLSHTHHADDDAAEQAYQFLRVKAEGIKMRRSG